MKRILLVDSSEEVHSKLKTTLDGRFDLSSSNNITQARKALGSDLFDLIVLETALSDGSGFSFCMELRGNLISQDLPIILVSENASIEEKLKGFSAGADDFLPKPFDYLELHARIEARLRNPRPNQEQDSSIQKGDLVLSIPFQKAALREETGEKDLALTPTEFRLLYYFVRNEGTVLSRTQLLSTIWSENVHVLDRTIDKHISTLKKKLDSRSFYIQSIHSKGYRFSIRA